MYAPNPDSTIAAQPSGYIPGPKKGQQVPRFPHKDYWVYQYHFEPAYRHAKHYTGSTSALRSRLHAHEIGYGARLTEVARKAGCQLVLCRLWKCESQDEARRLERKLKADHGPKLCPICQHRPADPHVLLPRTLALSRVQPTQAQEAHRREVMAQSSINSYESSTTPPWPAAVCPDPYCPWCWTWLHPGVPYPAHWSSTICSEHAKWSIEQANEYRARRRAHE